MWSISLSKKILIFQLQSLSISFMLSLSLYFFLSLFVYLSISRTLFLCLVFSVWLRFPHTLTRNRLKRVILDLVQSPFWPTFFRIILFVPNPRNLLEYSQLLSLSRGDGDSPWPKFFEINTNNNEKPQTVFNYNHFIIHSKVCQGFRPVFPNLFRPP